MLVDRNFFLEKIVSKLILLRHGQSVWNKLNLFTGWVDIPLSLEGIEESIAAGKVMGDLNVDVIYTSGLIRSQTTAMLAMAYNHAGKIPCVQHMGKDSFVSWHQKGAQDVSLIPLYIAEELNERMYGDLQGKNKEQMVEEFGSDQVKLWRRSFHVSPPGGESLAKTAERSVSFFVSRIVPDLTAGKDVFVCAHGNSLRAIVMYIEKLSEEEVLELNLATGSLKTYEYKEGTFLPL